MTVPSFSRDFIFIFILIFLIEDDRRSHKFFSLEKMTAPSKTRIVNTDNWLHLVGLDTFGLGTMESGQVGQVGAHVVSKKKNASHSHPRRVSISQKSFGRGARGEFSFFSFSKRKIDKYLDLCNDLQAN